MKEGGSRSEKVGRYFRWHLQRQVAFDIWWLVSKSPSLFSGPPAESAVLGMGNFFYLHYRTGQNRGR